jgi:hypothetical protein
MVALTHLGDGSRFVDNDELLGIATLFIFFAILVVLVATLLLGAGLLSAWIALLRVLLPLLLLATVGIGLLGSGLVARLGRSLATFIATAILVTFHDKLLGPLNWPH